MIEWRDILSNLRRCGIVLICVTVVGCSGSGRSGTDSDGGENEEGSVELSDYEIFDPSKYADEAASVDVQVDHDVPELLMEGRADAGVLQVVSGYRVQLFSSINRQDAVVAEESFNTWWSNLSSEEKQTNGLPLSVATYNDFKQPLYRIRAGDFTSRRDAERLMVLAAAHFSTVFVVPDQVFIRR